MDSDNDKILPLQSSATRRSSSRKPRSASYSKTELANTSIKIDGHDGIMLSWNDICVYASNKEGAKHEGQSEMKQILHNISGFARPGDLLAILGASGAGKSTLMNVFTGRNLNKLKVTGSVKVNGRELGADIKRVSAYVQQDDMFWGQLTVREHLWLQAVLRMGRDVDDETRQDRIDDVVREMGLEDCQFDLISIPKRKMGISGSERKLLSFASELLTDPPIMFCDEPTSGLDSLMAESVVLAMREMTSRGKTVVCTIHQPSSNIFALFQQVQLMADGRLAFLGDRQQVRDFFKTSGFPCPVNYNPADHYIHSLAIRPGDESMCHTKVAFLCDKYERSKQYTLNRAVVDKWKLVGEELAKRGHGNVAFDDAVMKESIYKSSWWTQIKAITWRHWKLTVRNPAVFSLRILQAIIYAFTISLIYHNPVMNQATVRNISGALFETIIAITFFSLTQLNSFTSELGMFYRDHQNALYRTDVYYLAKNIIDIPIFVLTVLITIVPTYWIVGFYPDFVTFLVCLSVFAIVYQFSLSLNVYCIAIGVGRVDIALNIAPIVRVIFMLLGGFYVNDSTIPAWLFWLQYLSWHHYSFEILTVFQWQNVDYIDCETVVGSNVTLPDSSCYNNGQEVIDSYKFSASNVVFDFIMLLLLTTVFRIFAYVALYIRSRQRKTTSR